MWTPTLVFALTDMPNCSRAMRITSLVVSMLPTASVLAWTSRNKKTRNNPHLQNGHLVAILLADARRRGAPYIGAVADILGENLQRDGLGVIFFLSLGYLTARLRDERERTSVVDVSGYTVKLNRHLRSSSTRRECRT